MKYWFSYFLKKYIGFLKIIYLYSATSLATNGEDQSIPPDELKPFKVRKEVCKGSWNNDVKVFLKEHSKTVQFITNPFFIISASTKTQKFSFKIENQRILAFYMM